MSANPLTRLLVPVVCGLLLVSGALAVSAAPISRDEVLVRAQTFCFHPWACSSQNLTASCAGAYQSAYSPGDYLGLPYDWGGYVTLFEFDDGIQDGKGAGSYSEDGVLSCTVGMDCSGFVSKVWDVGHFGTSTIHNTSSEISQNQVLPADAFNVPGYHVVLYGGTLTDGWPIFYEAIGYNTMVNTFAGWANVSGFTPIRRDGITNTAGSDLGSAVNPVPVTSFPYVHNGDTSTSLSDLFDYYGADTSKKESGPEVIYEVNVSQPGTLVVSVQDGAGVDIDVHLCRALESYECIARHDSLIEQPITQCGTWYVIADSWCSSGGTEYPGPYTLSIDLEPSGGGCAGTNKPFDYHGHPGEACGYPGDPGLPFCNPTLGATVCLYSDQPGNSFSFCTFSCANDNDCQETFPNGCCADVGGVGDPQDYFCVTTDFCSVTPPPVDEGGGEEDVVVQPPDVVTTVDVHVQDVPVGPEDVAVQPDHGSGSSDSTNPTAETAGGLDQASATDLAGGTDPGSDELVPGADQGFETTSPEGNVEPVESGGDGCSAGSRPGLPLPLLLAFLLLLLVRRTVVRCSRYQ